MAVGSVLSSCAERHTDEDERLLLAVAAWDSAALAQLNTYLNEDRHPNASLVALIAHGRFGKTTFAQKHFLETEVLCSDNRREAIVSDHWWVAFIRSAFELHQRKTLDTIERFFGSLVHKDG